MTDKVKLTSAKRTATPTLQLSALEKTIAIAEFSPDGVLQWANKNYLSLFHMTESQAIGRAHCSFCPTSFVETEDYDTFWLSLCQGIQVLLNGFGEIIVAVGLKRPIPLC